MDYLTPIYADLRWHKKGNAIFVFCLRGVKTTLNCRTAAETTVVDSCMMHEGGQQGRDEKGQIEHRSKKMQKSFVLFLKKERGLYENCFCYNLFWFSIVVKNWFKKLKRKTSTSQGWRSDPHLLLSTWWSIVGRNTAPDRQTSTLRDSSLTTVCECVRKWKNGWSKSKALWINVLYIKM